MVRRMTINRIVDIVGFAAAAAAIGAGLVMLLGFRDAPDSETSAFLSVGRESWLEMHESAAFVFVAVVLVHLALHWRQVLNILKQCVRRPSRVFTEQTVLLAAILCVALTGAMSPDEADVEDSSDCDMIERVLEGAVTDIHVVSGLVMAVALAVHISRRWRLMWALAPRQGTA
jgi:hypothetical protein